MRKAAFLDRDGVINQKAPEGAYITRWEDMKFLPGVAAAIAELNSAGWLVIIISNQRCVAKGLVNAAEVEALHGRMSQWLNEHGAKLDAIYYCPHEKTQPPCDCRKPAPGMLLRAAAEHHVDLSNSWMIGDSESDIEAGRRAGCKTIRIQPASEKIDKNADLQAQSLFEAVPKILQTMAGTKANILANNR